MYLSLIKLTKNIMEIPVADKNFDELFVHYFISLNKLKLFLISKK